MAPLLKNTLFSSLCTHTQTDTPTHASSVVKHQLHPPHPYSWDSCLGNSNHADIIAEGVYGVSGVSLGLAPSPSFTHACSLSLSHTQTHTQMNDDDLTASSHPHFGWSTEDTSNRGSFIQNTKAICYWNLLAEIAWLFFIISILKDINPHLTKQNYSFDQEKKRS